MKDEKSHEGQIFDGVSGRRLRIVGRSNNTFGYAVSVFDAETHRPITNITKIVVTLDAAGINTAEVTYTEGLPDGRSVKRLDRAIFHTATVDRPEIDVTAFEREYYGNFNQ